MTRHRKGPRGPRGATEGDDQTDAPAPLPPVPLEDVPVALRPWTDALSEYLDAELDHSAGAYRLANLRLHRVRSFLKTQDGRHPLVAGVSEIAATARDLNVSLAAKRYAAIPRHRLPEPPSEVLDFRTDGPSDPKRHVHEFYEVARGALHTSETQVGSLGLIRGAILLDLSTAYDVGRLRRRYEHRAQHAHEVLGITAPSPTGSANPLLADELALAGLHHKRGATPALVLRTMTQAHLDLHWVEHRRSQPVGARMSRSDRDLRLDDQALERSVALNTYAFAVCEALPWVFSAGQRQQRTIQDDPKVARATITPAWPLWIARQSLLLALYRRAHAYRLLGDHERAYNDLRKVQRIGRLTRTTLNDPRLHQHAMRPRMLHFVDALDALAEYRIGELYRADHDYSQALVHLCRSHERVERWLIVDDDAVLHPWLDRHPPKNPSEGKALFPQLEVNLRLGKGRAFFEIGSFKRSLKWLVRAWIALLELMSEESSNTDNDVRALELYLASVKHDPELDKRWLERFLERAVPEMRNAKIPSKYEALAAEILARIGQLLLVLRLADESALDCLTRARDLDRRNLLAQTGLLLCKLRPHYPEFEFMLSDPTTCWSSAASDVDQAIRAAEHLMLERLAAAPDDAWPETVDGRDVTIARRLIEDFLTHTDSINLRLAVLHRYLTRPRAPLHQPDLAQSATQAPYLEFVCLRRFGCFSPFMPRPAAVSAVGGGYLVRACWPAAQDSGKSASKVINVLIDPGEGTVNNLYRVGLGIADIDMVVATHDHPDHLVALDEILSLRHERHQIQGSVSADTEATPFVILGNPSVTERYSFLNSESNAPGSLRYTVAGISDESLPVGMPAEIALTRLVTQHVDLGGSNADGFVLTFRPSASTAEVPLSITFMSDTAIRAVGAVAPDRPTDVLRLNPGWKDALQSDIVVAHVSDVPSGELRDLAALPKQYGPTGVADFNERVDEFAKRRGGRDAGRLRHALSMIRRETDGLLRPTDLFEPAFLQDRADWEQHLYLHGLLAIAKLMERSPVRNRAEGGPRVLVIGEFREQLGSFRVSIAREINQHVFRPGAVDGPERPEHIGKPMALTADIGLRIRVEAGANRNQVLCTTCSRNNDRLDAERFHRPELMNEVCVKGDHEAIYWNCTNHIPAKRPEGPVFVEQMGGYDPFAPGGRYHG